MMKIKITVAHMVTLNKRITSTHNRIHFSSHSSRCVGLARDC